MQIYIYWSAKLSAKLETESDSQPTCLTATSKAAVTEAVIIHIFLNIYLSFKQLFSFRMIAFLDWIRRATYCSGRFI